MGELEVEEVIPVVLAALDDCDWLRNIDGSAPAEATGMIDWLG